MRLAGFLVFLALIALTTASVGNSRPLTFQGEVFLNIKGWGGVKPGRGFESHITATCRRNDLCVVAGYGPAQPGGGLLAKAPHVSLTATPYKGWRFARWRGPCEGGRTMRECAIDLSRAHTNKAHRHEVGLTAVFVPVTPGLTRGHPVRIGHAARIGDGFEIRINSATPRVQLTPAAPAGDEYFVANITATYIGGSSSTDLPALPKGLHLEGRSGHHYNVAGDRLYGPCPDTPPPALPATPQIYPGQSVTGNVCWTVATNDQSSLELYRFYPFRSSYQWRLIWFAFH